MYDYQHKLFILQGTIYIYIYICDGIFLDYLANKTMVSTGLSFHLTIHVSLKSVCFHFFKEKGYFRENMSVCHL